MLVLALLSVPSNLGYFALGVLIGVESMGVPVPGETALFAASILAHDGKLDITLVIAAAAVGAIVGDNIGYLIGRHGGRRLIEHPRGPFPGHRRRALEEGERFFDRHGPKAVFLGRWVSLLRITAAWLAGITHMPWRTFLLYNAAGGITWAISVGLVGYFAGKAGERIIEAVGLWAAVAAAVLLIAVIVVARWRRRVRLARAAEAEKNEQDSRAAGPAPPLS